MKKLVFLLLVITSFSFAEEEKPPSSASIAKRKSVESFEICTEFIERGGVRFQLGQVWFDAGENSQESKRLTNYTVDYSSRPFTSNFTFANLPKEKIWLECVYFACGDAVCSPEESSNDPEIIYHEVKKIPVSCQSKVKLENLARIGLFTCKYGNSNK